MEKNKKGKKKKHESCNHGEGNREGLHCNSECTLFTHGNIIVALSGCT